LQEWLLVRPEHLAAVPETISDVVAASLPVAYLTGANHTGTRRVRGWQDGAVSRHRRIGRNATYQLARAQAAGKVISTAGSTAKRKAHALGFVDVIDLTKKVSPMVFAGSRPAQAPTSLSIVSVAL